MTQDSLFDTADVHARISDPVTSEQMQVSLGKDTGYRMLVLRATRELCDYDDGHVATDDLVLDLIEFWTKRRHQRNVIARTRGLLERDGLIRRRPDTITNTSGREVITYTVSPAGSRALAERGF